MREEDTTAQIHREMLERTSAHLEHVDRLRLSRSFWLVLAAIIAFSIWCGIVVVQVVSDRGAVSRRGEWLLAAQAIDQRLIGQAADDHPEPMVLGASVVELRELSRRVVDDPSADKLAAALDDAIELSMRGADQIRVGELRESIARFTAICRQESGELSTRLGDRWDALAVLVLVSLASMIGILVQLVRADRRRRDVERGRVALERAYREVDLARRDAANANDTKSRFLANISHEIRTPMNGILGMVDVLRDEIRDPKHRSRLGVIRSSGEHLLALLNDILDISRIEAGQLTLRPVPMDMCELVRNCVDLFELQAKEKGVTLELTLGGDIPPRVEGDAGRLRQVLFNLVSNAIKFTDRGSVQVTVTGESSSRRDTRLHVEVTDTGPGIALEKQKSLFVPFVRLDTTSTRRHGGTGLGLAISREIIEAMHGQIGLRSALGRGSTFWFSVTLPRIDARAQTLRPEAAPATVEAAPPRLLIVDDNAVNREVASSQLSRLGYRVYEAADGEAALEAWEMRPYAALLLDCEMPGMDGFAVAGRVRSLERLQGRPRTPIIAMTAHPFEEIRQRHREAGMDDHVPKPFTPEDLARTVARWVRASGASEKVKVNAGPESSAASLDVTLASAPTVDRSVIDDLIPPDSGDARGELIDLFLREAGGDCEALVAAASSGEWEKVASLAHRIKGSGRNMGAMALGNVAEAIERAAKAGSLKPSSTSVRRITAVFADTAAGFRELHPGGARRKKKA